MKKAKCYQRDGILLREEIGTNHGKFLNRKEIVVSEPDVVAERGDSMARQN